MKLNEVGFRRTILVVLSFSGVSLAFGSEKLPDGQISKKLSSPPAKNILLNMSGKSVVGLRPSHPNEGRVAIVTNAGGDAVDADVPLTNGTEADGEVVWSGRRDAGVKFLGSKIPGGDGGKKARSPGRARYKP